MAGLGLVVAVGGGVWLLGTLTDLLGEGWQPAAVLAAGGAAALLGALGWLAQRGVRARRHLAPERYRGPGVLLLFVLAITAGNILSVVPLGLALADGRDVLDPGPAAVTALLLISPAVFVAVTALFVVRPGALVGLRLADGAATVRNLTIGIALGVACWVLATWASVELSGLVERLTGEAPAENQVVADLAAGLHPALALVLVGVLTPAAEELFFRGVAVNAWLREHGARAAVLGSAILFAAAHVVGGSWIILPPIFGLGLVLAAAYLRTRSLPLVFGVHATFNCLSVAVLFLAPI